MGWFGINYSKPGKGVDPNAPEKNAFFTFFELYGRRFVRLMGVNILYFLCIFPLFSYGYALLFSQLSQLTGGERIMTPLLDLSLTLIQGLMSLHPALYWVLFAASALAYGPLTAGLTYICRNFSRREHAWVSDLFGKAKSNWKQGLFFGLFDILSVFVLLTNWDLRAVLPALFDSAPILFDVIRIITVILFIAYFMMRYYIYQLMVTYDLKIREIFQNSLIFLMMGIIRNLFVTVILLVSAVVFLFISPVIELVALPLVAFSFWGFFVAYTTFPFIDRTIRAARTASGGDAEPLPEPDWDAEEEDDGSIVYPWDKFNRDDLTEPEDTPEFPEGESGYDEDDSSEE
ncbi:hypothetical protein LJC32_06295 [Oscillospiraceae bacterium OttesenSCG-928-F05]|nr:hypothetical protein [Oscillospiraceae bacterium OttesenSCG-928-F05]